MAPIGLGRGAGILARAGAKIRGLSLAELGAATRLGRTSGFGRRKLENTERRHLSWFAAGLAFEPPPKALARPQRRQSSLLAALVWPWRRAHNQAGSTGRAA